MAEQKKKPQYGRKLNPDMQERIIAHMKKSVSPETAAGAEGITYRSFQNWMRRGQAEWEAEWEDKEDKGVPEPGTYAGFFYAIRRAQSEAKVDRIKDALDGDGQGVGNGKAKCAQWLLERTDRQFQPKIAMKVEQEMSVLLDVLEAVLPFEHYTAVLEAMSDLDEDGMPRVLVEAQMAQYQAASETQH